MLLVSDRLKKGKAMKRKRIRVMQQVLNPSSYGGVSTEFRALEKSQLNDEFEFIPLILKDFHAGLNLKDIMFYYRQIKREKPEIVQIRGAAIDGLNAEIAAKMVRGTKILLCVHGMYSDFVYYNPIKHFIARYIIEPLSFTLADGISCVYKECSQRENFKHFQKKIVPFVYNRLPSFKENIKSGRQACRANYEIPSEAIVGIFCGRITKEKGLTYLLRAFHLMKESWKDCLHFLIVGEGSYLQEFKEAVNRYSVLREHVHFTGGQRNVSDILASADFFVLPSLHENHSIALLEAVAMELPCIVTDVGGNKEIIKDRKFGLVIEPYNAHQLEAAITKMCDKQQRDEFVNNIRESKFEEFSNATVDAQLKSAYVKTLEL